MDDMAFVDSNIFTYFLLEDTRYLTKIKAFFVKVNNGEVFASVNSIVFTEVLFNFVKAKIIVEENIHPREFIRFVKENPALVAKIDISPVLELFSLSD